MAYLNLHGLSRYHAGLKNLFVAKSDVTNELTVTEAGKVLDGRAGKALSDLIAENTTRIGESVALYTHEKTGTVHNFTGTGRLGYAILTASYAAGDTFAVNGTAVTVVGNEKKLSEGGCALFSVNGTTMYLYGVAMENTLPEYTYTGSSQLTDDGNGNWRIKLLTSGSLTFQALSEDAIDIFLVGGGGGADYSTGSSGGYGGGAGGRTLTLRNQSVGDTPYEIAVGAGGAAGTFGSATGGAGGNTTAFGGTANGGGGGTATGGGSGGTGGGGYGGNGGSDGGSGGTTSASYPGGSGQTDTTREFGEAGATLYSGGGGGATSAGTTSGGAGGGGDGGNTFAENGETNTGGGGGATLNAVGGAGGSGIVIIRNSR